MKQSVGIYQFRRAFEDYYKQDNFSYEGLEALFNYLGEYEDSCGTEIELDVIALCCEYSEYKNLDEVKGNYDIESMEDLRNRTMVVKFDGGLIIQNY